METIFKTNKKATYFKGNFQLRIDEFWANPIDFPTVFIAYGKGINSGNWQSCTGINTPNYVIKEYFDNNPKNMAELWEYCKKLSNITWKDVTDDRESVLLLINLANNELLKLDTI